MPIALSPIINLFNNVESTDPIVGAVQTPSIFQTTHIYCRDKRSLNGYEKFIFKGQNGFGSQVLLRKLGKGNCVKVKANCC